MLVVRRTFRDSYGLKPAGTLVEPAGVQRLKYQIGLGYIVEVTEQNYSRYSKFFKERYGLTLPNIPKEVKEPQVPKPVATPVVVAAKPAVAAVKATK